MSEGSSSIGILQMLLEVVVQDFRGKSWSLLGKTASTDIRLPMLQCVRHDVKLSYCVMPQGACIST